jgi:hypothetical protein
MKPMIYKKVAASVVVMLGFAAHTAVAGPYSDDLARCLVGKTTNDDKTTLMTWIFSAISLNPAISQMAAISPAQRKQIDSNMAALVEHLMTETCRSEARTAVQYEGSSAIEHGFGVLGEVAGRELFASPEVAKGLANLDKYVDPEKIKAVFSTGD